MSLTHARSHRHKLIHVCMSRMYILHKHTHAKMPIAAPQISSAVHGWFMRKHASAHAYILPNLALWPLKHSFAHTDMNTHMYIYTWWHTYAHAHVSTSHGLQARASLDGRSIRNLHALHSVPHKKGKVARFSRAKQCICMWTLVCKHAWCMHVYMSIVQIIYTYVCTYRQHTAQVHTYVWHKYIHACTHTYV
jgi:hypothetical protein